MLQVWAVNSFWTHAIWDPVNKMRDCRCVFISTLAWLKPGSRFNQHVCLCSEIAYLHHPTSIIDLGNVYWPNLWFQRKWFDTRLLSKWLRERYNKLCQSDSNFRISSRQTSATASFSHTFPMASFRRFVKRCYVTGDGWFLGGVEVGPLGDPMLPQWGQGLLEILTYFWFHGGIVSYPRQTTTQIGVDLSW